MPATLSQVANECAGDPLMPWGNGGQSAAWASVESRWSSGWGLLTGQLDHHGGRARQQSLGVLSNTCVRALVGRSHAGDVQVILAVRQGLPVEGPHVLWLRAGPGHTPQGEGCVEVHFNGAARSGGGILKDSHTFRAVCRAGGRDTGGQGGWHEARTQGLLVQQVGSLWLVGLNTGEKELEPFLISRVSVTNTL